MANQYQYLSDSGVIVADTAVTREQVEEEYRAAFGDDLDTSPETPQGVLITAETLARDAVIRNNAALANQINPNLAGGVFLDAVMALTGTRRDPAERSTVVATLSGVPGTIVPAGVVAATVPDGDRFELTAQVVLDVSGQATGTFQCLVFGAVLCPIGALTQIVTGVLGWETVTNLVAATPGRAEQSDEQARAFRRNALAIQGQSTAEAITSGLYATDNVKSLQFRENFTNATATIDGISLVAHSVWACVDGGTDADVAATILRKKSAGANMNGAVTVSVLEPASGQTYPVKFDRPTPTPVVARVTIKAGASLGDPISAVKDAVVTYATGGEAAEPGFTVGTDVSAFEIAGAVNRQYPSIFVLKVEVSLASTVSWSTDTIDLALNQIATIDAGSVTVVTV
jgi:uncharacterized phage protein gp47/JayE